MPCDNFFAEVISVTRGFKVALAEELHFRIFLLYLYFFTKSTNNGDFYKFRYSQKIFVSTLDGYGFYNLIAAFL